MIRALVTLSAHRYGALSAITLLALILGSILAMQSRLDVFPEFVPSQVDIQTEALGFAPQQIEELITRPIESALSGATGVAAMRSESIPGLSVVSITFNDGVDPHFARQEISERLSEMTDSIPAGAGSPKLSPLVSSTMDLLKIGLLSNRLTAFELRDIADWVIKPRLLAAPGVAHVIVFGGDVRQIQILPDPVKLASFGLSLTDIVDAGRAALPLRGAGFLDTPSQRILLESPTPEPNLETIKQAVVAVRADVPVKIRDLATVQLAPALRSGDALIMGKPGVLLSLASQYGANTLTATREVERALADLEPMLKAQGVTFYGGLHRPANFIERALSDLERSLAISAILILLILYLFLRNLRAALIAFLAIPLSLLAAIAVLNSFGQTINTMTLGGFAVALGVLVDDAIIGIENILRRLREADETSSQSRQSRLEIVRDASLEVRGPIVYATIVVIAVFLPELFTSSLEGRFVGPLSLAFILAVTASLIVAMTSTTALSALLLRPRDARPDSNWLVRLKALQARLIASISARLAIVIAACAVLFVASLALLPALGGTFMPDFREGHFVMQVSSLTPGLSLEEMRGLGTRISAEVLKLPYVQSIEQQLGRAELSEDTWGTHRSEFHIELKADTNTDQRTAQDALRKILDGYPGVQGEVVTFLGDRIGESLSGETAQVAVKVFGDDLDALDRTAEKIMSVASHVKGVTDLQFKRQSGTPALSISLSPQMLANYGLTTQSALDTVQTAYAGSIVGQTFAGTRSVDVAVLLPNRIRNDPREVGRLPVATPFGPVPLSELAHIEATQSRYSIEHDGGRRRVSVTFNVSSRSLQSAVAEVRSSIERSVNLPRGVVIQYAGAAEAEQQTRMQLIVYSLLATAAVVMILLIAFHWRASGWLVLANVPFSLIGGVLALAITGVGLSLGAAVGLVTVFGISARNAILQLAHYEHLVENEHAGWNLATLMRGANERLTPILMTAAVTALGLAPLALNINEPGQEIGGPMAIVVLGGLVSSTLLNLLLLPALSWRYVRVP